MFKKLLHQNYGFCTYTFYGILLFLSVSVSTAKALEGSSLWIVNAETGEFLENLDGTTWVNLTTYPAKLTIVDEIVFNDPSFDIGSVIFYLNDKKIRTENVAPYALGGDVNGVFTPFQLPVGEIVVKTEYYSLPWGQGELLFSQAYPICVINFPIPNITLDQYVVQVTVPAGMQAEVPFQFGFDDPDGNFQIKNPEFYHSWLHMTEALHLGENTLIVDASNLKPGKYDDYVSFSFPAKVAPCEQASADIRIEVTVVPSDLMLVSELIVVDATADKDACAGIGTGPYSIPAKGFVFSFDALCLPDNLSMRAETYGAIGSVMFEYSFTAPGEDEKPLEFLRTENVSPFALFGDLPTGNYAGIPKKSGLHKIRATPFSKPYAQGIKGIPLEIEFNLASPVVYAKVQPESPALAELPLPEEKLLVYPNPMIQASTIHYAPAQEGFVNLVLFDIRGNQVRKIYQGKGSPQQTLELNLNRQGLEEGVYILRIESENGVKTQRIKIER